MQLELGKAGQRQGQMQNVELNEEGLKATGKHAACILCMQVSFVTANGKRSMDTDTF